MNGSKIAGGNTHSRDLVTTQQRTSPQRHPVQTVIGYPMTPLNSQMRTPVVGQSVMQLSSQVIQPINTTTGHQVSLAQSQPLNAGQPIHYIVGHNTSMIAGQSRNPYEAHVLHNYPSQSAYQPNTFILS